MMWTRGSTTWVDTSPRGRLSGKQVEDKPTKLNGPTGIVGLGDKIGGGAY